MKGIHLKLRDGSFTLCESSCFKTESSVPVLCYEEHGFYNVVSNPERSAAGETVIYIPRGAVFEYIDIDAADCALTACALNTGNMSVTARSASCEFSMVRARRISADFSRGAFGMTVRPLVDASFCCGFGSMKLRLCGRAGDYRITAKKGSGGMITVASEIQPRSAVIGNGAVTVKLSCGLGSIETDWV